MISIPYSTLTVNGLHTRHIVYGEGAPVLLLHGWGANADLLWSLGKALAGKGFSAYMPDLPGFGESAPPPVAWTVYDYVAWVLAYMDAQGIQRAHLFGHSFGGRLSIILGARHAERVDKIVLCDSAGVLPSVAWHRKLPADLYHRLEALIPTESALARGLDRLRLAYRARFGSEDYRNAGVLRETFVLVVNEDLLPLAPHMTRPTLLVWGANDQDTPLSDAKQLEAAIPDAGLVVFPGAGHYSYLDAPADTLRVLDYFYKHDG